MLETVFTSVIVSIFTTLIVSLILYSIKLFNRNGFLQYSTWVGYIFACAGALLLIVAFILVDLVPLIGVWLSVYYDVELYKDINRERILGFLIPPSTLFIIVGIPIIIISYLLDDVKRSG